MGATVQKRRWSGLWKSFTFLSQKWNSRQGPCGSWATGRWFSRPVRSFKKESRDRWRFLTSTNIDASCIGYHARITKLLRGSRASQKREKSISPRAGTMPECNETFWQWYLRPRETDRQKIRLIKVARSFTAVLGDSKVGIVWGRWRDVACCFLEEICEPKSSVECTEYLIGIAIGK